VYKILGVAENEREIWGNESSRFSFRGSSTRAEVTFTCSSTITSSTGAKFMGQEDVPDRDAAGDDHLRGRGTGLTLRARNSRRLDPRSCIRCMAGGFYEER